MKTEASAEEPSACILSLGQQGQSSHLPSSVNTVASVANLYTTQTQHEANFINYVCYYSQKARLVRVI